MIERFVAAWERNKGIVRKRFEAKHPEGYSDIVKTVITAINDNEDYEFPDPSKIHEIDDGHYQGTLLYVIPQLGYQPSTYFYVKVGYGSCSACDTYQDIRYSGDYGDAPSESQVNDYMTLALHIVQGLKEI